MRYTATFISLVAARSRCIINDAMNARNTTPEEAARQIARECLALRVQLLNRVISRIYDDALRPLGLTMTQVSILTILEMMNEAQPGDIGQFLQMEKSTVSRNMQRMREQKWLREQPGSDARRVLLSLTEKGRAMLAKALPFWAEAQKQVRELLGVDSAAAIAGMADRITARGE